MATSSSSNMMMSGAAGAKSSPMSDRLGINITVKSRNPFSHLAKSNTHRAVLQDSPRTHALNRGGGGGDSSNNNNRSTTPAAFVPLLSANGSFITCPAFMKDDGEEDDEDEEEEGNNEVSPTTGAGHAATTTATSAAHTAAGEDAEFVVDSAATPQQLQQQQRKRKAVKVSDILNLGSFGHNACGYTTTTSYTYTNRRSTSMSTTTTTMSGGGGGVRGRSMSHQSQGSVDVSTTLRRSMQQQQQLARAANSTSVSGSTTPQQQNNATATTSSSFAAVTSPTNVGVTTELLEQAAAAALKASSNANNSALPQQQQQRRQRQGVIEEPRGALKDPLLTPLAQHYLRLVSGSTTDDDYDDEDHDGDGDGDALRYKQDTAVGLGTASPASAGSPTMSSAGFVVIDSLSQALGEGGPNSRRRLLAQQQQAHNNGGLTPQRSVHPHASNSPAANASPGTTVTGPAAVLADPNHYYPFNHNGASQLSRLHVRRVDIAAAEEMQLVANQKRRQAALQRMKHLRLIQMGLASSAAAAGVLDTKQQSAAHIASEQYNSQLHNMCPEMAMVDEHIMAPLFEYDEEEEDEEEGAEGGGGGAGPASPAGSTSVAGGAAASPSSTAIAAATAAALAAVDGANGPASPTGGGNRAASPLHWNDFSPAENWATMKRLGFPCSPRAEVIEAEYNAQPALNAELNTCDYHWNLSLRGVAILGSATVETCEQLRKLSRKHGIPSHLRHLMWMTLSGVSLKMDENEGFFKCVSQKFGLVTGPSQEVIEKDLERTFPDHPYFAPGEPGVHRLRLILHALCWRNPLLGYCQSFNFIAAILLLVLNDDEGTFFMMCHILEHLLPNDYYSEGLMGIKIDQKVFVLLLDEHLPRVSQHFDDIRFDVQAIIPAWLMSLYVNTFPIETLLRVWDYMVTEKSAHYSTVPIAIALAFLKTYQDELLRTRDPGDMMMLLNKLAACEYDGARLVKTAHEFELKPSVLHNHRRRVREEILIETEKRKRARERFEAERKARLQSIALQKAAADQQGASRTLSGGVGIAGDATAAAGAIDNSSMASASSAAVSGATPSPQMILTHGSDRTDGPASPVTAARRMESTLSDDNTRPTSPMSAGSGGPIGAKGYAPPSLHQTAASPQQQQQPQPPLTFHQSLLLQHQMQNEHQQSMQGRSNAQQPHGHDRIAASLEQKGAASSAAATSAGAGGARRAIPKPLHHTDPNHPSNATSRKGYVSTIFEMKDLNGGDSNNNNTTTTDGRAGMMIAGDQQNFYYSHPRPSGLGGGGGSASRPAPIDRRSSSSTASSRSASVSNTGSAAAPNAGGVFARGGVASQLPMGHPKPPRRTFY